jgi:hypothetical protein
LVEPGGADIHAVNKHGYTPLHCAQCERHLNIMLYLVANVPVCSLP